MERRVKRDGRREENLLRRFKSKTIGGKLKMNKKKS